MHAVKSLALLILLTSLSWGQAPATKPGLAVTLRIIRINDSDYEEIAKELAKTNPPDAKDQLVHLNTNSLIRTLNRFVENRSTMITQSPVVQVPNGRSAKVNCGQEVKFTTSVEKKTVKDQMVYVPKMETIIDGLSAKVTGTIAADGHTVEMHMHLKNTTFDRPVALLPVTTFITPQFEGGSQGTPIPLTQFIQQPVINTTECEMKCILPNQGAVMFDFGKTTVQERTEFGPPIISQIPYINRLFKNQTNFNVTYRLLVIPQVEIVELPAVMETLADYRQAVAAGKMKEAKEFAMQALAIDPACFAK